MTGLSTEGLIETLELLLAQVKAYRRALPPDNIQATLVLETLGELAQQALNEAMELEEGSEMVDSTIPITARELEVLTLAAKGLTNKEIAYRLGISERTVQFHLRSIFNKTTTNSRTEAVAIGMKNGWVKI